MPDPEPPAPAGAASPGLQLVFGASGYVGRHLVPRLAEHGRPVRAAARRLRAMQAEGWQDRFDHVEIARADALDAASLAPVLEGVETAFYLVHSMTSGRGFPARDRQAAESFAAAAARAGVRRIVYLGGLAPKDTRSAHLASRVETGDILRRGPVPVTELRAGIIVGAGSAAFEVMRDLVAHLPMMVAPKWVQVASPPVALDDLLEDLIALSDHPQAAGGIYETGGERLSYVQMMQRLAHALGKRRRIIVPVPLLTPELSGMWLDLVSGVPGSVSRALIAGLRHDLDADDSALRALVPRQPMGFDAAVARTLQDETALRATDRWREGAFDLRGERHDRSFYGKQMAAGAVTRAGPEGAWAALEGLGTRAQGYFFATPLWRLRAGLDRLLGGRQHGPRPKGAFVPGQRFDFWRVLFAVPGRRLTLISGLVAPGDGGFEFELTPEPGGGTRIEAVIHWHPAGVWGLLYWYLMWVPHVLMLRGFVRALARVADRKAGRAGAALRRAPDAPPRR